MQWQISGVKWICDELPPINLWSVWKMSGGVEDMDYDERMKMLQKMAPHSVHYQQVKPEPIEVIEAWDLGFHLGNAVKYIARAPYKGSKKQDLEKAIWYLQRELNKL